MAEGAFGDLLQVLAAEQLLLEFALQRGRQVRLLGGLGSGAVERLGDDGEAAGDVEDAGGSLLDQQNVVGLWLAMASAGPGGGEQGDRTADAEAIAERVGAENLCTSRDLGVFVDQPTETIVP